MMKFNRETFMQCVMFIKRSIQSKNTLKLLSINGIHFYVPPKQFHESDQTDYMSWYDVSQPIVEIVR